MSEPQKSLAGYKSKVQEGTDYENPNEGKGFLDDSEEYVLHLVKIPHVIPQTKTKEKEINGVKTSVSFKVETAVCEFVEKITKNIVVAFFRVDSLNFSDEEKFESGVIRFFKKIKHPLVDGVDPKWEDYFIVGMRFRARVVVKKDKEGKPTGTYYLDVPTCRPLLPSDKAGEDFARDTPTAKPDATLDNALLLAKGAKDFNTAMDMLKAAGSSKEVAMALFNANLDGKVTFPV